MKNSILHFCSEVSVDHCCIVYKSYHELLQLKDQAVSLCDVVAPPDHILQSAIGSSDGQVRN